MNIPEMQKAPEGGKKQEQPEPIPVDPTGKLLPLIGLKEAQISFKQDEINQLKEAVKGLEKEIQAEKSKVQQLFEQLDHEKKK